MIGFRPAIDEDFEFIFELHKATLGPYVDAVWGWVDEEQRDYLGRALSVQNSQVIVIDGVDAGRLTVQHRDREVYVGLIEINRPMQGLGIGSHILRNVLKDAFAEGKCVRLNVLGVNAGAYRLYSRLGFIEVAREEVAGVSGTSHQRIEMLAHPTAPG
ncbi:GNAT family N-acetyltransferase [Mycobacterium sp. NPDC004974]